MFNENYANLSAKIKKPENRGSTLNKELNTDKFIDLDSIDF